MTVRTPNSSFPSPSPGLNPAPSSSDGVHSGPAADTNPTPGSGDGGSPDAGAPVPGGAQPNPAAAQDARRIHEADPGVAYLRAEANRRLDAALSVRGATSSEAQGASNGTPALLAQVSAGGSTPPVERLGDAHDPDLDLVQVNGEFIGADGAILRVPTEVGYLDALESHMIQPQSGREPVVSGNVIAVNGVTVPATTASANAQRIADQLGAPTIALYNGPHNSFPNAEDVPLSPGRAREFAGAFAHSNANNRIDGQNLAQRLGRIMIEHIDSGATEPLTVVSHSEGASFTRAGFDVARGWLMERGMSAEEAEATLRENVDYIGLGSGSSRQSDAVDGVQYLHLDDRIVGGLGLARNWGAQSSVVFAEADSDNNHATPGYINRVDEAGLALEPGFYFQRADGQIVDAAIQREELRAGGETVVSHHLVALNEDGTLGDRVWSSSPAMDRLGAIFQGARQGGLPVETADESQPGVVRTIETIRLSDLEEMPPAFSGRPQGRLDILGNAPERYDPNWTPRAPNWPDA